MSFLPPFFLKKSFMLLVPSLIMVNFQTSNFLKIKKKRVLTLSSKKIRSKLPTFLIRFFNYTCNLPHQVQSSSGKGLIWSRLSKNILQMHHNLNYHSSEILYNILYNFSAFQFSWSNNLPFQLPCKTQTLKVLYGNPWDI